MFGDFKVGETYNRRADIHALFRGQQQGGIATPAKHPVIFAFTGSSGAQHGYADGWTDHGVFRYFGEGQEGNMRWKGGNKAIRDHVPDGKDLLLFETLGGGQVRCMGQFVAAGHEWVEAPDRRNAPRQAIVFNLVPLERIGEGEADLEELPTDLLELRRRATDAATGGGAGKPSDAKRSCYTRSAIVKAYVLSRAKGVCESCGRPAPFKTQKGAPYLEPHHIRRLSDGGPDHPSYVGAVCPNCHREIHYGQNGMLLNAKLADSVQAAEALLEQSGSSDE
ncbi:MAG: HNH endonuclease signature motif containing protein [Alphaproteobacteria bacterium]|nr:HNH endonuclease signature motif containing protein [Alphaproteobacteria bacterium]